MPKQSTPEFTQMEVSPLEKFWRNAQLEFVNRSPMPKHAVSYINIYDDGFGKMTAGPSYETLLAAWKHFFYIHDRKRYRYTIRFEWGRPMTLGCFSALLEPEPGHW